MGNSAQTEVVCDNSNDLKSTRIGSHCPPPSFLEIPHVEVTSKDLFDRSFDGAEIHFNQFTPQLPIINCEAHPPIVIKIRFCDFMRGRAL